MTAYTARQLPHGGAIVLHPDGLTWEEGRWPELPAAERHAARLNEWAAARPCADDLVPLLGDRAPLHGVIESDSPEALGDRLEAIVDRFYAPERALDALSADVRRMAAR